MCTNASVSTILSVTSKLRQRGRARYASLTAHNRLARPTKAMTVQPDMAIDHAKHHSTRLGRLPYRNIASVSHLRGGRQARHPPERDADAVLPWPSCTELWRHAAVAARPCRVLHALQAWQLTCAAERHMRGRFARHLLLRGQPRAWRRGRAFNGRSRAHFDRLRSLFRHMPKTVGRHNAGSL